MGNIQRRRALAAIFLSSLAGCGGNTTTSNPPTTQDDCARIYNSVLVTCSPGNTEAAALGLLYQGRCNNSRIGVTNVVQCRALERTSFDCTEAALIAAGRAVCTGNWTSPCVTESQNLAQCLSRYAADTSVDGATSDAANDSGPSDAASDATAQADSQDSSNG